MEFTTVTRAIELDPQVKLRIIETSPRSATSSTELPKSVIIYLHFWGGSSNTWLQVNSLVAAEYPTISIDFRGWGQSTGPDVEEAYSTLMLAEDVENIIQRLSLTSYIIVGHSMGAKVAQAVAGKARFSGLKGLVLVAPAPPTPLVLPEGMRDQQIHAYEAVESASFVVRNVLSKKPLTDDVVAATVKDMLGGNRWAKAAWPRYAMGDDILGLAKCINVPVLVIASDQDVVETMERVENEVCANISGCKLIVVRNSGHLLPLECPGEVAENILTFSSNL